MFAKKALAATAAGAEPIFVEEVFQSWLYTGNGGNQTITNGIDLSGEGGLVWIKERNTVTSHRLVDTVRGATKSLVSNLTNAEATESTGLTAFNSSGFALGASGDFNGNTDTYVSWTFRKAEKFFDVVTYTGNGTAGRTISHNLGSTPGCIIVKCTNTAGTNWRVYHRSLNATYFLGLESTAAAAQATTIWNDTEPTSTVFSVGSSANTNESGWTYVAYLFAHDAGGFGDDGNQSVISCGSFTTNGADQSINLGFEPQWMLVKNSGAATDWFIADNMRGWPADTTSSYQRLRPNLSNAEDSVTNYIAPTATGFKVAGSYGSGATLIYIAIRRGPMKTPTSGTSVFSPVTSASATPSFTTGFPVDSGWAAAKSTTDKWYQTDRLRGDKYLNSASSAAEAGTSPTGFDFDYQNGFWDNQGLGTGYIGYGFRRAPGFFDVVCYTGTGSATTISHNLGVAPELMIVKRRTVSTGDWHTYVSSVGATKAMYLNLTNAPDASSAYWNDTSPTSSVFSLGTGVGVNANGSAYVAYLFASLTGVSKVGSYTGNGSNQTINCGFTAGARFILIKRTDSTGDWYVYDSARGIVSGNDPQLKLNSTAAEATGYDAVDPDNSGFIVNNDATNFPINVNNATYIYLAIA